jgi:nucleotide-binding universal stress UspA family protein
MSSGAMMRARRASSSAYDGSDGAKRALDRAVVEARDRHVRTAVASVASMPLDLEAPRHDGTLDDISLDEGRPLSPPPEIVVHLEEAREILAAAGVDPELTSAAGEPGHEIVAVTRRVQAKTIVLGEHHHASSLISSAAMSPPA